MKKYYYAIVMESKSTVRGWRTDLTAKTERGAKIQARKLLSGCQRDGHVRLFEGDPRTDESKTICHISD